MDFAAGSTRLPVYHFARIENEIAGPPRAGIDM